MSLSALLNDPAACVRLCLTIGYSQAQIADWLIADCGYDRAGARRLIAQQSRRLKQRG